MLYVHIPTLPEFRALAAARADVCVSLSQPTTPPQEAPAHRTAFGDLADAALRELATAGFDTRQRASRPSPRPCAIRTEPRRQQFPGASPGAGRFRGRVSAFAFGGRAAGGEAPVW